MEKMEGRRAERERGEGRGQRQRGLVI